MKILSLETSSSACSVALLNDDGMTEKHQILNNTHSQFLLAYIEELLLNASLKLQDLDALAVGNGPGSFTGLRLGMGVAHGLAFGAKKPLVPVSSLQSIAVQSYEKNVLVAVDARMGEVYWQCFATNNNEQLSALTDVNLTKPESIELPLGNAKFHGVGSGWDVYSAIIEDSLGANKVNWTANVLPRAHSVALLAKSTMENDSICEQVPNHALPVYIRNKVTH